MFRAGAELVPTAVTVRDGDGRLVTSLQREDFHVSEAGTEQPITQFTGERVPVNLALVLDVSDSMRGPRMEDARQALRAFLADHLKPEDEAALLVFNHATRVLSNWSTDREPLLAALDEIKPTGGTAIYDAIDIALPLFDNRRHPRAAIVLISDGADTASDTTVIELKQRLGRGRHLPLRRGRGYPQRPVVAAHQPAGLPRALGAERRLCGDHRDHRRHRAGHGQDCRGAERPVHARLHADDAGGRATIPIAFASRLGRTASTTFAPVAASCGRCLVTCPLMIDD